MYKNRTGQDSLVSTIGCALCLSVLSYTLYQESYRVSCVLSLLTKHCGPEVCLPVFSQHVFPHFVPKQFVTGNTSALCCPTGTHAAAQDSGL